MAGLSRRPGVFDALGRPGSCSAGAHTISKGRSLVRRTVMWRTLILGTLFAAVLNQPIVG